MGSVVHNLSNDSEIPNDLVKHQRTDDFSWVPWLFWQFLESPHLLSVSCSSPAAHLKVVIRWMDAYHIIVLIDVTFHFRMQRRREEGLKRLEHLYSPRLVYFVRWTRKWDGSATKEWANSRRFIRELFFYNCSASNNRPRKILEIGEQTKRIVTLSAFWKSIRSFQHYNLSFFFLEKVFEF